MCICVWETDIKRECALCFHCTCKWEGRAVRVENTQDCWPFQTKKGAVTQNEWPYIIYGCVFEKLSFVIHTCTFLLFTPHQFEVWISLPGCYRRQEGSQDVTEKLRLKWTRRNEQRYRERDKCTPMKEQMENNKPFVMLNAAIPPSELPTIYHFVSSRFEHAVYFLYQHIFC